MPPASPRIAIPGIRIADGPLAAALRTPDKIAIIEGGLPEATQAAYQDGWFVTGDLARLDDEGCLYLVDRKNDMVISGGENIYPREVEEVLLAHPSVQECGVTSAPDPYWGEAVTAFIVPRPGIVPDTDALVALCRENLSRYKVPKEIRVVENLPRNSMGKILRRSLRDRLRAEQADKT